MNVTTLVAPRRVYFLPTLAGLVFLLATGCSEPPAPPAAPPPTVSVAHPVVRPAADARRYTGRLQAAERVEVRARVKGFLNQVLFLEGVEVPRGTALYEIDPRPFQAEVDQARAEVARFEAEYAFADREAERVRQIRGSVSVSELDRHVAARAAAAAGLARGKARLEAALLDLSFTKVAAPIDGRVGRTLVTAGNLVGEGEPTLLTTVVRSDPLHLVFEVTEGDLLTFGREFGRTTSLSDGAAPPTIRFGLDMDDGFPREAVVDFRDTEVNSGTGTVLVRAVVPNPDRALSPGLFARVEVSVPRLGTLPHVPEAALGTDQQGRYVFVVDADGKAQRRGVVPGPAAGGLVAVERGLTSADRVVVAGQVKVRPGMPVVAEPVALDPVRVAKGGGK
jgi:multidrug efflux system membrane fusion protein